MLYCIDPSAEEPIMLINKHIGMDDSEGMGIDGSIFQNELLQLDRMGKKRIQVWINSPGGIVMDGYNIYNAILKSTTKVDTYCVGIAASIAAVIFQAGRTKYMSDYAHLMYHDPHGGSAKELDPMRNSIATMIAKRIGKTEEEILSIMKRTTWISASEALMNGFCDEIEISSNHNKKRLISTESKAMWKESNLILNSIFKPITETTMLKVTNKLGLTKDANEDSILDAIQTLENKAKLDAKNAADAIQDMKDKLDAKEKEFKDMTDAFNKMKAEKETADKLAKDANEKAEDEKCKNLLEGFAKSGRIKNDAETLKTWSDTAKQIGIDKVKAMIEAIPNTKLASKIDVSDVSNEANLTNVVAATMATNREKLKI